MPDQLELALTITLGIIYILLLILEQQYPLRQTKSRLTTRIMINLTFTALVFITALLFIAPVIKNILNMSTVDKPGLLPYLNLPSWFDFILGFLALDLTFYYWHRLNHEIPLLWRFHNVHHCDPDLDVTTSMRFHFVEIAYSSLFRIAQLSIIGLSPVTFFIYEFAFQANTFFHHSNIKIPLKLEKVINKVLVTPRMHGIHHSDYQQETNSNYSVVLSFWDRLHRTLKLNISQRDINIGVAGYQSKKDNDLFQLIIMPFIKQKPYWEKPSGRHHSRPASNNTSSYDMLD